MFLSPLCDPTAQRKLCRQPNLTTQALMARSATPKRPFILTRAFYAGSQRFGAMWTGDNLGTWEHMTVGVQMVLANGIAGMTFGGCG
jgi:alpha 1,3-glucosidase